MTARGARIVPIVLVLAGVAPGGGLVAAEKTSKVTAAGAGAADATRIKQLSMQARSARAPGGSPDVESKALLSQLTKKYTTGVEAGNARTKARFAAAVPVSRALAPAGSPPGAASGESASAKGQKVAPDPCGSAFDLKAISASPPLDPGEAVLLEGCGFGPSPPAGEVRLLGDFPGGHIKLTVDGWTPTKILAYVPMVTGVPDMPAAKIQVFRKDGKFTNWLDVGFRATRVVQRLRPADVSVTCGIPQLQQECALASSHPLSESQFFGGATFAGKHPISATYPVDCDDALEQLKSGGWREKADSATVGLKNGWLLAGFAWWWTESGHGYVLPPTGFAQDSTSSTMSLKWGVFAHYCGPRNSVARYRVDLYAYGPKGVPYK